jgi:hypothetical protein
MQVQAFAPAWHWPACWQTRRPQPPTSAVDPAGTFHTDRYDLSGPFADNFHFSVGRTCTLPPGGTLSGDRAQIDHRASASLDHPGTMHRVTCIRPEQFVASMRSQSSGSGPMGRREAERQSGVVHQDVHLGELRRQRAKGVFDGPAITDVEPQRRYAPWVAAREGEQRLRAHKIARAPSARKRSAIDLPIPVWHSW